MIEKFKQNQNDELKNLRIKIEELERQLKISEEKNIRNENELKENKKVIKELKDEINQLKEQIKIKDQEIKNLHEKIKILEELINKNSLNTTESILKSNHDYIDDKNNNKNKPKEKEKEDLPKKSNLISERLKMMQGGNSDSKKQDKPQIKPNESNNNKTKEDTSKNNIKTFGAFNNLKKTEKESLKKEPKRISNRR